jgi:ribosomal protein L29
MKRQQIDELHQMTVTQLQAKAAEIRQDLAKAQLEKTVGKLDNPRLVSTLRDDLARVLTIKTQKELVAAAKTETQTTEQDEE